MKWSGAVAVLTAIAAAVGLYGSAHLYMDLRTDLEELLPESAQSVKDVRQVVSRVGGFNHLSIVIESPEPEANRRFRADLTEELKKLPPSLVARVEDNVVKERQFFLDHKHLYMDLEDWRALDEFVESRIAFEKAQYERVQERVRRRAALRKRGVEGARLYSVKNRPSLDPLPPQFDFKGLEEKYRERSEEADRLPEGQFQSENGFTHVVLAFLPGKVTDQKANEKLHAAAKAIVEKLNPKRYDRSMVVGFNGDVSNLIEEHEGLIEDLELSTIIVLVLVAAALYAYFRTFAGVYALCAALFAGTFWTFGLTNVVVGYLNANTAFLGSIVIGNGINFGIILLARYMEERRKGASTQIALASSMAFTVQATAVAAAAAGVAYASLMVTDFRGFNQFGIIGGMGMAFCWISTFTVLPALIVLLERRGLLRIRAASNHGKVTRRLAAFVAGSHKQVLVVSAAALVLSLGLGLRFGPDTLESDFSKLRNKRSIEQGSGYWGRKVDSVFQRYLTPTVIVTKTHEQAVAVATKLKEIKRKEQALSPISDIRMLEDFIPADQEAKIAHIRHIQGMLTPKVLAHVKTHDKRKMAAVLPPGDMELRPLTTDDLPEGVKVHFRELDGTLGRFVHVYPRLASGNFWDGREVIRFANQMRQAIVEAGVPPQDAAIAGQPPLSADMIASISRDGPKATVVAFGAVTLLVILVFRSLPLILSIVGALLLGVLWMAGVMAWYDLKINFLNFIALPITFGIGVDYSVNVISRYHQDRRRGLASVEGALRETGGAVALCSLTTIIGYGSLLIAGSQAFVSFGVLSVLGEVTCIVAALVVLPAAWVWYDSRKFASQVPVRRPRDDISAQI